MACDGLAVEAVDTAATARVEFRFSGDSHLLVVAERTVRRAGETFVQGLPSSTLHDLSGRMSFVPAGHSYYERHELEGLSQAIFIYLDPAKLPVSFTPEPRALFQDSLIFALALNLKQIMETSCADAAYLQAIGVVLAHQLARPDREQSKCRGGLARWQQRTVAGHIEEQLDESVRLSELARLAHLSPYHFARCFKQSFGVPPHRYHVMRRIERANVSGGEKPRNSGGQCAGFPTGTGPVRNLASRIRPRSTRWYPKGFKKLFIEEQRKEASGVPENRENAAIARIARVSTAINSQDVTDRFHDVGDGGWRRVGFR